MPDNSDPQREALHEVIQQTGNAGSNGGILTGWLVVAEWIGPDGERYLSKCHAASTTQWAANGMAYEFLNWEK